MRDAMINILICDNDTVFVEEFKSVIINEFQSNGIKVNVVVVCSSEELFEELKYNIRPDALFIDIELGEENGIDVVSEIRKKDRYLDVVFVSAYNCYYYSAFKQRPIAFLNKPIDVKECKQVLSEIYYERCLENRVFSIKSKRQVVNEKYSDILYVESDRRYVMYYLIYKRL